MKRLNQIWHFDRLTVKLTTFIVILLLSSGLILLTYQNYSSSKWKREDTEKLLQLLADNYNKQFKSEFENAMLTGQTLASLFAGTKDKTEPIILDRLEVLRVVKNTIESNSRIYGIRVICEPGVFPPLSDMSYLSILSEFPVTDSTALLNNDSIANRSDSALVVVDSLLINLDTLQRNKLKKTDSIARWFYQDKASYLLNKTFAFYCFTMGDVNDRSFVIEGIYDYDQADFYNVPKKKLSAFISQPFIKPYISTNELFLTFSYPIVNENVFYGIVSIDINLDWLQEAVEKSQIDHESTRFCVFSNNGTIVAINNEPRLVGKTLKQLFADPQPQLEAIAKSEVNSTFDSEFLTTYLPMRIGNSSQTWQLYFRMQRNVVMDEVSSSFGWLALLTLLIVAGFATAVYFYTNKLLQPLAAIAKWAKGLAQGDLDHKPEIIETGAEITVLTQNINQIILGLRTISNFASDIGKGNVRAHFTPLSESDRIGNSLIEMQQSLLSADEEDEKRREEDKIRNWISEGVAKFNDILRTKTDSFEDLAYLIIKNMVDYFHVNQGGLFVYVDDDKEDQHFELKASYAYNRRRHLQRKIAIKEGIIGMVAVEKQTVYLKTIPQNYIEITSGLGHARPNSLLVVPLKREDKIFGVVELASFNPFAKHEIQLVEDIADDIASTLETTKIAEHTNKLLEESRRQAEEMVSQEEEMRQNLEELQATQESAARKEMEMNGLIEAIDYTIIRAELQLDGTVTVVNNNYLKLFEYEQYYLIGKNIRSFISPDELNNFEDIWLKVLSGEHYQAVVNYKTRSGRAIWLIMSYTPIRDNHDDIEKVLYLAQDITQQKQAEVEAHKMTIELNNKEQEFLRYQKELESVNQKLLLNEKVLKRAFDKARQKEKEIEQKNIELADNEKRLREKMDELQRAHDRLIRNSE